MSERLKSPERALWRYWTTTELKELRDLRHKGLSVKELARHMGRTPDAVQSKVYRLGILKNGRAWGWTEEDRETAIRMWSEGKKPGEIGYAIGKAASSVCVYMQRHGLKGRRNVTAD